MDKKPEVEKTGGAVRREEAARYYLIAVLSFVASLAGVRLFLQLTGYPQIAGGDLHISHVLWGGLFMFVAALAPLVLADRKVYVLSAVLSGVGIALFIDEVGKFITKDYNYHYPAAAPIVYIFFLLTLFVYLRLRRPPRHSDYAELVQSLEAISDDLNRPLPAEEWAILKADLVDVAHTDVSERQARLASLLLEYVKSERRLPKKVVPSRRQRVRQAASNWLTEKNFRPLLAVCLAFLGLLTWKNPLEFAPWAPPGLAAFLHSLTLGGQLPPEAAPELFAVRVALEVAVGALFLASSLLLLLRRKALAVGLAYLALLAAVIMLDIPVFYFEQFSAILTVGFQYLVLLGLLDYRHRYPFSLKKISALLRDFIEDVEHAFTLHRHNPRHTAITQEKKD
jgi:hypothetical protein